MAMLLSPTSRFCKILISGSDVRRQTFQTPDYRCHDFCCAQRIIKNVAVAKRPSASCRSQARTQAALTSTLVAEEAQVQDTGAPSVGDTLIWTKQWYPLHSVQDLDASKPHAITLLGRDLVLWSDASGSWKCFEDLCPHRKVPLSEGRVERGNLQCAYHGWEFNATGRPVNIPQISDKAAVERACRSQRSCCISFPTQVQQGLVWVWPESGPQASSESALQGPATCPEYEHHAQEWTWLFERFVRDVPGSFEFWVENMTDQSHVPHAHAGVAGSRHFDEGTELFQYLQHDLREGLAQHGFGLDFKVKFSAPAGLQAQSLDFQPPALCKFTGSTTPKTGFALWIYAVPASSSTTRLIISAGFNASKSSQNKLASSLISLRPRWLGHMTLNGVTDGDICFMHRQSSYAQQRPARGPLSNYFLPSPSDRGVAIWHQWMQTKGGGGPVYANPSPTQLFKAELGSLNRQAILDRQSHVSNCSSCTQAVKQIKGLQQGAKVASIVAGLFAAWALGHGADAVSVPTVAPLLVLLACTFGEMKLRELERHFGFLDWQHSEH